jgi:histone deacetylase 11
MIPIFYHPAYNITAFGLERLHPFDSRKYRRIHDALIVRGLRRSKDFIRPRPASRNDLLKIHTADYLRSIRQARVLARVLEVPVVAGLPRWLTDWRILRAMRYATGGTVAACRAALQDGAAINIGGGYHSTDVTGKSHM